jgi:dodecin
VAIHKVIEVISQSDKSWEDAAQQAVKDAAKSVKHIRAIDIDHFSANVDKDKIVNFRVNAKITFEIR